MDSISAPLGGVTGGIDPAAIVQARLALAAQKKVLDVQRQIGAQLVALLEPSVGQLLDVKA